MTSPEPSLVLDLLEGFRRSKTMFAAVSLGVFDALERGPAAEAPLAEQVKCDAPALGRLLHACVALGLLIHADGQFANSPIADRFLVSASPDTLVGYIRHSDISLYPLWAHLEDAVREGSNRWEQAFGEGKSLFDHFFRTDESRRSFLGGMHGYGCISSDTIVHQFDLSGFRTLADLGGATGHLSISACRAYPNLSAVVFDLPLVGSLAQEYIAGAHMDHRIRFVAGNFFSDPLPQADLYCLGRILHDWGDSKIDLLLGRMFDSLPSGGALLIAERLMNPDRNGPVPTSMQDLNMLVCTDGRERSCREYEAVLRHAGFASVECRHSGTIVDAILARKR
jgi:acetylserotonin N-methyltransferase